MFIKPSGLTDLYMHGCVFIKPGGLTDQYTIVCLLCVYKAGWLNKPVHGCLLIRPGGLSEKLAGWLIKNSVKVSAIATGWMHDNTVIS